MRPDVTFDPLMREPSVDDIDAFRRDAENGRHGELASAAHSGASSRTIALISAAALCVIAIPVLIIGNWITWVLVPIVCVAIFVGILLQRRPPRRSYSASWPDWQRLARFADANGWGMNIRATNLPYTGRLFRTGMLHTACERIFSNGPGFFDVANLEFRTWRIKSTKLNHWHYVAIRLSAPQPPMYLTVHPSPGAFALPFMQGYTPNRSMTLTPAASSPYVALSLPGGEADPNRLFTPELRGLLVDRDGAHEVEVIGEWMFLFREGRYPCFAPEWWERMLRVIDLAQTNSAAAAS